jgi:hypothetical protein
MSYRVQCSYFSPETKYVKFTSWNQVEENVWDSPEVEFFTQYQIVAQTAFELGFSPAVSLILPLSNEIADAYMGVKPL